jgi:hypothetical protein
MEQLFSDCSAQAALREHTGLRGSLLLEHCQTSFIHSIGWNHRNSPLLFELPLSASSKSNITRNTIYTLVQSHTSNIAVQKSSTLTTEIHRRYQGEAPIPCLSTSESRIVEIVRSHGVCLAKPNRIIGVTDSTMVPTLRFSRCAVVSSPYTSNLILSVRAAWITDLKLPVDSVSVTQIEPCVITFLEVESTQMSDVVAKM